MSDKNKNSSAFGPLSILAITMLTLIGSLFGAVSYLLLKYYSPKIYSRYDAKADLESNGIGSDSKLSETPAKTEWIIYMSDNCGFSFRHPTDWRITRDLFSENFILVATNKTYLSETSGEIRIETLKETDFGAAGDPEDDSAENGIAYACETTFSHSISLAGKEKKESVRFHYLELDENGEKIPKEKWKYFEIYKKIIGSFSFVSK